jgi:hypothetical protein
MFSSLGDDQVAMYAVQYNKKIGVKEEKPRIFVNQLMSFVDLYQNGGFALNRVREWCQL